MVTFRPMPTTLPFLLLVVSCAEPQEARLQEYLPMMSGRSLHYEITELSAFGPAGGESRRQETKFTAVEAFRPATADEAARFAGGAAGVIVKLSRRLSENQSVAQDLTSYISSDETGLLLHAAQGPGEEAELYERPLRIVPAIITTGERWDMGTLRQQGMLFPTSATMVGIEEVSTEGGAYTDCLHLAYSVSRATGEVAGTGGLLKITEGTSQIDRWLARGVGLVKEHSVTKLAVTNGQGAVAEISKTRRQHLVSVSP